MPSAIETINIDEYQALVRMTQHNEPFVAKIAQATLAIVEARRDAQVRAEETEAALAHEKGKLRAIKDILRALSEGKLDGDDATRQIGELVR